MQTINTKTAPKRIVIGAQSFGFGPVSKACAIAKELLTSGSAVELSFIADSISKEFIQRENLWQAGRDFTIEKDAITALETLDWKNFDAAIVVLDPVLATFFQHYVPTYFVDSLGFMWYESFFQDFPQLQNMHTYFVQDVFGARAKLTSKGVKNLVSVGAILNKRTSPLNYSPNLTFHLGGLINIFDHRPIQVYVNGIIPIIDKLSAGQDAMIFTSHKALRSFEISKLTNIPVADLPHDQVLSTFSQSKAVFTSPGLTTLLELLYLNVPCIPLPPQNMSQALIVTNLVKDWKQAPEIWSFLAENYPLTEELDEAAGVQLVQAINAGLLLNSDFQETYLKLALAAKEHPYLLPETLVSGLDGVAIIRDTIFRDLGLLSN